MTSVKLKEPLMLDGKRCKAGQVVSLPADDAAALVRRQQAERVK
jgi:hypothetical protein